MKHTVCELCNRQASLYCASDSAFLCWNCDATVHHANFLVARHIRHLLCSKCNRLSQIHISGAIAPRVAPTCRSCSPENRSDAVNAAVDSLISSPPSSSPSSSTCVSSSESCATAPKKIKVKKEGLCTTAARMSSSSSITDDASSSAEAAAKTNGQKRERAWRRRNMGKDEAAEVFVNWSRVLGVNGNFAPSLASQALGFCLRKWTSLPFRVAVATSFWLGLRFSGDKCVYTFHNLRRLEAISGVPAKLILAAQAKLARVFPHRHELREGWAEC